MKRVALIIFGLSIGLKANAAPIELTLNCEYERASDMKGNTTPASGSFSAVVRMDVIGSTQLVSVETTTPVCSYFVGSFTNLTVDGECERSFKHGSVNVDFKETIHIDRINGSFDHVTIGGSPAYLWTYSGRCVPAKKLF